MLYGSRAAARAYITAAQAALGAQGSGALG
jgi:hypothetical protein